MAVQRRSEGGVPRDGPYRLTKDQYEQIVAYAMKNDDLPSESRLSQKAIAERVLGKGNMRVAVSAALEHARVRFVGPRDI